MELFFNYFKKYILAYPRSFLKSFFFVLLLTFLNVLIPISLRYYLGYLEIQGNVSTVIIAIIGFFLFLLLKNIIDIFWTMSLNNLGGYIIADIRIELINSISDSNYEDLLMIGRNKLKNIVFMDTLNIFRSIVHISVSIIADILILIVFILVSTGINTVLGIVLFLASCMGFLISMISRNAILKSSRAVNEAMKLDNEVQNELIDSIEILKTWNLNDYFLNKTSKSFTNFIETSNRVDKKQIFLKNLINDFHFLVSVGIVSFLTLKSGNDTAANFVFYIFVSDMVIGKSQEIEGLINSLLKNLPSFEHVDNILNLETIKGSHKISKIETINFNNVKFHYDINRENTIINNLNASFIQGDRVRITGSNGAGKSTLIKIITGLLSTKSGKVLINNIPIKDIDFNNLKENIIYIGQNEFIMNDTVSNYLSAMAGYELSNDEIARLMERVNFDSKITEIKDGGNSLSGGQRKKLMLMKLLLKSNSSIIIIDEIEAGMDKETLDIWETIEKDLIDENNASIIFRISHKESDYSMYNKEINLDSLK